MESAIFIRYMCSPQHVFIWDGIHNIYSQYMESTAFKHEICNSSSPPFTCSMWWGWQQYWSLIFIFPTSSSLAHNIYSWMVDSIALTHDIWNPRHLIMRDGVNSIYSRELESTVLIPERWSPHHLCKSYGVQSMYSWVVDFTPFTHERWGTEHLLMRNGVHNTYPLELGFTTFLHDRWSSQNLLMRNGVHNIYSRLKESTACKYGKWNYYCRTIPVFWGEVGTYTDGVHSIYSWQMDSAIFTREMWSPQHLFLIDGIHNIYSQHMKSVAITHCCSPLPCSPWWASQRY